MIPKLAFIGWKSLGLALQIYLAILPITVVEGKTTNSLFDKYLSNKEQHHIFNKIENVVECFYKTDIKKFIRSLLDNGFISKKTYYHLNYKLSRTLIRRDNLFNKGNEDNEVL